MDIYDFIESIWPFLVILIIILVIVNFIYYTRRIIYKDINKKTAFFGKPIVWLFIGIIFLPSIYGISSLYYSIKSDIARNNIKKIIEKDEQIKIPVDDFISEFITNFAKAEDFYKGKTVQITGIVDYIGIPKDNPPIKDNACIVFSGLKIILLLVFLLIINRFQV